ncbi:hypothetical protein C8R47DRAFT_1237322 [Mycena vitilis]|nr:hypothetical protein C8R47DRAFT_1237322 [Mycena vitilis]
MKVLILGATGFIGFPAAQALARAGHTVYGLARTEAKAKTLAVEEIIPILGDISSDNWLPHIATIDAVIETVTASPEGARGTFERVVKAARELRPAGAPLLTYIYTSGTWVHGDNRTDVVTDTTPLTQSVELVAWRPAVEQLVVSSTAVNGVVVRPGLLYGRSGSILGMMFATAKQGRIVWPGTPGGRWSVVHADDLADLYLRVTEGGSIASGKIFDATNGHSQSVDDLLQRLVEVSGAKGYEYRKPDNVFEEAIASSGVVRPYLANTLLGWSPKKPGLVDGLEAYYATWLATAA